MKRGDDEMVHIGLLHAFRFANRKLVKDKMYKFDSANLEENLNLEVLSSWHLINDKAVLISSSVEFISVDKYIATVSSPMIDPDTRTLFFSENDFKVIESAILELTNASTNVLN